MSNIYHDHLKYLRKIKTNSSPAISIYVPLRLNDLSPGKLFSALVKAADSLLLKEGWPKLELTTPEWDRWIKQGTLTLAIFHHAGVTSLIPIAIKMQPRVVVANSFHVKPIITAANEYIDSLLLHFHESGASLYRLNPIGETLLDSYLPSKVLSRHDWPVKLDSGSTRDFLEFLNQEVRGSVKNTTKILGITGSGFSNLRPKSFWETIKLPISFLDDSFQLAVPQNGFSIMRLRLSQIVNEKHSKAVLDALRNSPASQDKFSLRGLGTRILNKEINHLCVSLDDMQFGELDIKTGHASLNKFQSNTNDDDLLDDLVELAVNNGIKVSVVPKKYLPSSRSFVAS
jgi:hypothetical protein